MKRITVLLLLAITTSCANYYEVEFKKDPKLNECSYVVHHNGPDTRTVGKACMVDINEPKT